MQASQQCPHTEAVKWNPYNRVVQCHGCGVVFVPISEPPGPDYLATVQRVYPQAAPCRCEGCGSGFWKHDGRQRYCTAQCSARARQRRWVAQAQRKAKRQR